MATNLAQLRTFLDEYDLKYQANEENQVILIGFGLDPERTTFRDEDGDAFLRLVIRIHEEGEFISVFAPAAWNIEENLYKAAVFEAIASIQMKYKMLRFDYDPADGEIRPNIELPLEDSDLTSRQFHRLIHGVMHGVCRFDRVIRRAMETGDVSFDDLEDEPQPAEPADETARLEELADRAGGIDALEKLLGGGEPDADAA